MVNMDNIFSQIMTQGKEYKIHFQVQDLALGLYERNSDPDETQKAAFFPQQWESSSQSNQWPQFVSEGSNDLLLTTKKCATKCPLRTVFKKPPFRVVF